MQLASIENLFSPVLRETIAKPCSKSLNMSVHTASMLLSRSTASAMSWALAESSKLSSNPVFASKFFRNLSKSASIAPCARSAFSSSSFFRLSSGFATVFVSASKLFIPDDGSSNLKSRKVRSSTVISPRAPVFSLYANSATADIASGVILNSIP